MTRYEKRLGALFQRHGLCQVHAETDDVGHVKLEWHLRNSPHAMVWTMTDALQQATEDRDWLLKHL